MRISYIVALTLIVAPLHSFADNYCEPTPHRTTGTHYEPVTEEKINVSKGVIVRGQILSANNCLPVANAKVAHWQGGENGRYQDRLRAYMFTDEQGHFEFETEWPNMPSPHIHFVVTADGYNILETQWIGEERQTEIEFDMVLTKKRKKKVKNY